MDVGGTNNIRDFFNICKVHIIEWENDLVNILHTNSKLILLYFGLTPLSLIMFEELNKKSNAV